MLDFIHRGFYIGTILFFMLVGVLMILIGQPDYLKSFVSQEAITFIYNQESPTTNTVVIAIGTIITFLSFIIGVVGGYICRFSKKVITPKNVDVLRAQDVVVFLIDGIVYKRSEAAFYNLVDLTRLRIVKIRNLYLMELEDTICIITDDDKDQESLEVDALENLSEEHFT